MNTNTANTNGRVAPSFFNIINDILSTPMTDTSDQVVRHRRPATNVVKSEDKYTLQVAAPGLKKEDFSINIENGKLTISADVSSESSESTETYQLREFSFNSFKRTFTLPKNVNADEISANYTDGILSVSIPVAPEAQPKKIEIK